MGNAVQQDGRLATFQESCFQAAKRSDMNSIILEGGRFSDAQDFRFQTADRSDMFSAVRH